MINEIRLLSNIRVSHAGWPGPKIATAAAAITHTITVAAKPVDGMTISVKEAVFDIAAFFVFPLLHISPERLACAGLRGEPGIGAHDPIDLISARGHAASTNDAGE
jgi:hypothetical protein